MDVLGSILDNIDHSLIITDRDGGLLFFNREAAQTAATLSKTPLKIGEPILSYVSRERKRIISHILRDVTKNKETVKAWAEYKQLNGLTMLLELRYTPIVDQNQNVSLITILGKDVTSSRIFEKKIRAQAANVENLIQKANAVIISTDSRGYITNWNEHCTRLTGFEKNEVYTKKLVDIVLHESARQTFRDSFDQMLSGDGLTNFETKIQTKSGKVLTCLLSGTPQLTTSGHTVGVIFVGQDITELTEYRRGLEAKIEERTMELRRALQKEKELVDMKTRFVAVASHEFRTPLSSIQFSANFLKQYHHRLTDEERDQKLDNIVTQVDHMVALISDVLTFGKNEIGKIELILSTINVRDFIDKIAEDSALSRGNTHRVVVEYVNAPARIETDAKLLRSIVGNLLTNAIKFSPDRDTVFLTVTGLEGHIKISVRDEGLGIPPDELQKVFEPFLRGKGSNAIAGTGLGLSITRKGVELLGGTIEVQSEVSKGTLFTVYIPMSKHPSSWTEK